MLESKFYIRSCLKKNQFWKTTSEFSDLKTTSNFFNAVLMSPWVGLLMLESKFYSIPARSYLSGWGWGWGWGWVGGIKNKANSVQFQLKLPV